MRCQKCGFISFDQRTSCSKCGVDQSANASTYVGTGQKTEPPFFLAAALGEVEEQAMPETEMEVAIEEPVADKVQDAAADLFGELEAESQGIIPAEEPAEAGLSFEEPEAVAETEEISLEIPEEETAAIEEESLEISLEIPEEDEKDIEEELPAEPTPEPEESLEITLEIPEEEVSPPAPEEQATDTTTAPSTEAIQAEDSIDLSLEMPTGVEDLSEDQSLDLSPEPAQATTNLDLEEIDLSDLVTDSDSAPAPTSDNDEIFDLSSLMGDTDEEQGSDELTLSMDVSDEVALDAGKDKAVNNAEGETPSGLSLEKED